VCFSLFPFPLSISGRSRDEQHLLERLLDTSTLESQYSNAEHTWHAYLTLLRHLVVEKKEKIKIGNRKCQHLHSLYNIEVRYGFMEPMERNILS
jgi:hypothetical protein